MRVSVVYMAACPHSNVPKMCQLLILTCQRAKDVLITQLGLPIYHGAEIVPVIQLGFPTCHKACQFFNFACQKA